MAYQNHKLYDSYFLVYLIHVIVVLFQQKLIKFSRIVEAYIVQSNDLGLAVPNRLSLFLLAARDMVG